MSKDGLPVIKPKGKSVVAVEIIDGETLTKESFDLERIEKELRELDKQGGFFDQFFGSSDERAKKKLEIKTELLGARHAFREQIIDVEKQRITARTDLLELKAKWLEKEFMSQEKFQKTLLEIKLTELNIKKLLKEIEEHDLIQRKKTLEKEAKEEEGPEENYDLKAFNKITKSPDDQGSEENGE